jgi:hypothetical protein
MLRKSVTLAHHLLLLSDCATCWKRNGEALFEMARFHELTKVDEESNPHKDISDRSQITGGK